MAILIKNKTSEISNIRIISLILYQFDICKLDNIFAFQHPHYNQKEDSSDIVLYIISVCKGTAMGNDERINSPEFSDFIEG